MTKKQDTADAKDEYEAAKAITETTAGKSDEQLAAEGRALAAAVTDPGGETYIPLASSKRQRSQPFDDGTVLHHPNVIVALGHARAEIQAIGKSRRVTEGAKFNYRGIEDVINGASQVCARHGITVVPRIGGWQDDAIQKGTGSQWHRMAGEVMFDVYGPAGIEDMITGSVVSHADDNADKGPGKLHSYALKTFLIQLLMIPTEDLLIDNEAVTGHPANNPTPANSSPPPPSDPEDLARVVSMAKDLSDAGKAELKAWLAEKHVSLQSVDTIGPKLLVAAEKKVGLIDAGEAAERTGDIPSGDADVDERGDPEDPEPETSSTSPDPVPDEAAIVPEVIPPAVSTGEEPATADTVDQLFLTLPKGQAMKDAKDKLEAFEVWPIASIAGDQAGLDMAASLLREVHAEHGGA